MPICIGVANANLYTAHSCHKKINYFSLFCNWTKSNIIMIIIIITITMILIITCNVKWLSLACSLDDVVRKKKNFCAWTRDYRNCFNATWLAPINIIFGALFKCQKYTWEKKYCRNKILLHHVIYIYIYFFSYNKRAFECMSCDKSHLRLAYTCKIFRLHRHWIPISFFFVEIFFLSFSHKKKTIH
jgi:hypothetical protein